MSGDTESGGGVRGVLLLTPQIIGFVAEAGGDQTWTVELNDVLRVLAQQIAAAATLSKAPW